MTEKTSEPTFTTEELTMLRESLAQASVPVGSPAAPVALGLLGKLDSMLAGKSVVEARHTTTERPT